MYVYLALALTILHPFYVGLMDITYYEESETFGISIKLFTDDLEKGVEKIGTEDLRLATSDQSPSADSLVADYILKHISVSGKEPLNFKYLGMESEYDVTWIYLESEPTEPSALIVVENDILMEIYEDQTHVVHYTVNGETKSELLHRNKRQVRF